MKSTRNLWEDSLQKLNNMTLGASEFHIVRISDSSYIASYCGRDTSNNLLLAFRTTKRPLASEVRTNAFESYISQRPDKSWLYVLRLLDTSLMEVFESLCIDLIEEVSTTNNEDDFVILLRRRIKSWQKLFLSSNDGLLPLSQIIGLIGELIILFDFIQSTTLSPSSAISAWQGPFGADQDFITNEWAAEVKTIRSDIKEVSIASLDQLNNAQHANLSLIVLYYLKASSDDAGSVTLNSIVTELEYFFENNLLLLREFKASLLEAGYVFHEQYGQIYIKVVNKESYEITENFPKLLRSNVASGISSAQYRVSLDSIAHFKEASYPYAKP